MSFILVLIEFRILDVELLKNLCTLHGFLIETTVLSSLLLYSRKFLKKFHSNYLQYFALFIAAVATEQ